MAFCVSVKLSRDTYKFELDADATIDDLRRLVCERTQVEESRQKLLHKGKVLGNAERLADSGVKNNANIMLLITSGDIQTKGQVALQRSSESKLEQAKAKLQRRLASKEKSHSFQDQLSNWRKLKMIPCRDQKLTEFPLYTLDLGSEAEVADFAFNQIPSIPHEIHNFKNLRILNLKNNQLSTNGIPLTLFELCQLRKLHLDANELTTIPKEVSQLIKLRHFSASGNRLSELPDVFGNFMELSVVEFAQNQLAALPPTLGCCKVLHTLDLRSNQISIIPENFSQLVELRFLRLDENRINEIQSSLLKGCQAMVMLSLHGNGIQLRNLRTLDGFDDYENRRRSYYDKKIDGDSMQINERFDEGIDNDLTSDL
eukprot:g6210.t1